MSISIRVLTILLVVIVGCQRESSEKSQPAATLLNLGQATELGQIEKLVSMLDPTDRELVRQRQMQFDKLDEKQKQSLREIHKRLCGADSKELYQTLHTYSSWLATLPDGERATLLELPPAERIAQIKARQQHVTNTPFDDIRVVVGWLQRYVEAHEPELLRQLPREAGERMENRPASRERARMFLLFWELAKRADSIEFPASSPDEIATLVGDLSDRAHQELSKAVDFSNPAAVPRQLLTVASQNLKRRVRGFDQARLTSFYESDELTAEQRSRLDRLPPEEAKMQLLHLFQLSRMDDRARDRPERGRRPDRFREGSPDHRPPGRRPFGRRPPEHPPGPPPYSPNDRPPQNPPQDE